MATDDPNAVQIPMNGMGLYRCNQYHQSIDCHKHVEEINQLRSRVAELQSGLDRMMSDNSDLEVKVHRIEAEVERLRKELKSIANQKLESEIIDIDPDDADYRTGYDCIVRIARAALRREVDGGKDS